MDTAKSVANTSPTAISWTEDSCDVVHVEVAGTFSSWSGIPMARSSCGEWTVSLDLAPGRHEYKILVDGDWRIDDSVPSVPNDMGSSNNVFEVHDLVIEKAGDGEVEEKAGNGVEVEEKAGNGVEVEEKAGDGVEVEEKAGDGVEAFLEGTSSSQVETEETRETLDRSPTRSGKISSGKTKRSSFSKKSDMKATSIVPNTKRSDSHLEENPLLMSPVTRGRLARVTAGAVKMSCGINIGAKSQTMNPHSAHTQVMAAKLAKERKVQPSKSSVANGGRAPLQKGTAVNNGRFQATKSAVNVDRLQQPKGSLVNNGKSQPQKGSLENGDRSQQPKSSMENGKRPVASTSSMVGVLKPKNQENKGRSQPIPRTTRPVLHVPVAAKTATAKPQVTRRSLDRSPTRSGKRSSFSKKSDENTCPTVKGGNQLGKPAPTVPRNGRRSSTKAIDG